MSLFTESFSANEWTPHELIDSQGTDAVLETAVSPLPERNSSATTPTLILAETGEPTLSQQKHVRLKKLPLLQHADWDQEKTYDEDPPQCIHYSIEWKVTIKGKRGVHKGTVQDPVLAPGSYWQLFLKPSLEDRLRKRLPRSKDLKCHSTKVVVSVTKSGERNYINEFDYAEIDWSDIEKQLLLWGEFFRAGKKLRVDLLFNYEECESAPVGSSSKRGEKRGRSSTTRQMLEQLDEQVDAEEDSLGHPSAWRHVYNLMRCPGPPCPSGGYCWQDPIGKKHYKLNTHQLESLVRHVQKGFPLETHDDVPEDIRQQLYAEEQQRLDRKHKVTPTPSSGIPPITINNVLPDHFAPATQTERVSSAEAAVATRLDVSGLLDDAVRDYTRWQQSRVRDEVRKVEYQKACDAALEALLDLQQIHEDRDFDFFVIKHHVPKAIARRFIDDIEPWVKLAKHNSI